MVAVDDDPRAAGPGQLGKLINAVEAPATAEQDLADEDEVMAAAPRRGEEAVGEIVERFGGDGLELEPAVLGPASELAARAVELAVAGQHPQPEVGARR